MTAAAVSSAGQCAACGAVDALTPAGCARCGGAEVADTLVVIRGCERPHARVPSSVASLVVERLAREGTPARAIPARLAWTAIPPRTWGLIASVILAGSAAGALAAPVLAWVTPLVAGTLLVVAERLMQHPVGGTPSAAVVGELPPRLRRVVEDTLAALPPGETRTLLADVLRRARTLLGSESDRTDAWRPTRDVVDLVDACCGVALEHARLDVMLREPALAPPDAGDLRARCEAGRTLLGRRLREAAAVLGEMYVQRVERGGPAAERVAELTSELAADAAARRHAAEEIERLLGR